ncbi:MAG: hypothetical protein QOG52_1736 [Frankiaceae bacterium]|jgi:hypothetical protein|nr:hypothetical protein [Frankiaceae bacterium]
MSNFDVRDTVRTPAINLEESHPPEQVPHVGAAPSAVVARTIGGASGIDSGARSRLVAYVSRWRTARRDARRIAHVHGVHDRVMYEQVVRTISFRSLK